MKRVYYYTPPEHALDNLKNQQLKISRFSQLNDPFELIAFCQHDLDLRERTKAWSTDFDQKCGLLCFSKSWQNPVMWSHYAKDHTGVCYGFDVDPNIFVDVQYIKKRLYPDLTLENFFSYIDEDKMEELFASKYSHWEYEQEVRLLVSFDKPASLAGIIFHVFSEEMQLKEVVVGPKSKIKVSDVKNVVSDKSVDIFKSRLAFKEFKVVRQNVRTLWN